MKSNQIKAQNTAAGEQCQTSTRAPGMEAGRKASERLFFHVRNASFHRTGSHVTVEMQLCMLHACFQKIYCLPLCTWVVIPAEVRAVYYREEMNWGIVLIPRIHPERNPTLCWYNPTLYMVRLAGPHHTQCFLGALGSFLIGFLRSGPAKLRSLNQGPAAY